MVMPASVNLVSLDHAKDWAKRLLKHGQGVHTLAQAHAAVAVMLGHASWHALDRHYANQAAPPPLVAPTQPLTFDESMVALCEIVNQKYPAIQATRVVEMARELDLLEKMPAEIAEEAQEKYRDGYFMFDAVHETLKAASKSVHSPMGHMLIRVQDAAEKSTLVLVSSEEFGRALGPSAPVEAGPSGAPGKNEPIFVYQTHPETVSTPRRPSARRSPSGR
jgi:hypothetical protein